MKKVIFALVLSIISVPFTSFGMTIVDVEQQLNIYKGQSPSVLGASTVTGTADTNAKVTLTAEQKKVLMQGLKYANKKGTSAIINTTLKSGANSDEVKELQLFLNATGSNLPITGKFGSLTKKAVMDFQKSKGLKADGVVGPKAHAAIATEIDSSIK